MKKFHLHLPFAGPLFGILAACNSNTTPEQVQEHAIVADTLLPEIPEYVGRLYTSGLSKEEAEKLEISWPVYQLAGHENYFISGHDSLADYIGHCIRLEEAEKVWAPATETVNGQFTYQRGLLRYSGITFLDQGSCNEKDSPGEEQQIEANEPQIFRGIIGRMNRPAPDIAYDYILRLEEPFRDEHHPVEPGKLVKELPLFVVNPEEIAELENSVATGRPVLLKGALAQGYAERKVLQVKEVD